MCGDCNRASLMLTGRSVSDNRSGTRKIYAFKIKSRKIQCFFASKKIFLVFFRANGSRAYEFSFWDQCRMPEAEL